MASDGDMMHGGGGGKFDGRGAGDYDQGGSGVIGTVISEDKVQHSQMKGFDERSSLPVQVMN